MKPLFYIGLISGTSMDAVDCALIAVHHESKPELIDFLQQEIPPALKERLLTLCEEVPVSLRLLGETDVRLGRVFARAAKQILDKHGLKARDIEAIGSHGQTIWHQPPTPGNSDVAPFTLQIADPNVIAHDTGITTVADFRRRDMAAGGEGAPLMPLVHRQLFHSSNTDRVVVNLGGISNISLLPANGNRHLGFDVGPANVLMDTWIRQQRQLDYDDKGGWAASGKPDQTLLDAFLQDPYFSQPYPKSTGREYFNAQWLQQHLAKLPTGLPAEDVQRTLLELSARTLADAIIPLLGKGEVIACGGGANNDFLLKRLQDKLPTSRVMSSNELGYDCRAIEASGFAWLASQTLQRRSMDSRLITGASAPVIMGGVYYA